MDPIRYHEGSLGHNIVRVGDLEPGFFGSPALRQNHPPLYASSAQPIPVQQGHLDHRQCARVFLYTQQLPSIWDTARQALATCVRRGYFDLDLPLQRWALLVGDDFYEALVMCSEVYITMPLTTAKNSSEGCSTRSDQMCTISGRFPVFLGRM
ncbi:hypothetical protein M406DRAFT_335248 [Cryphonectria parasitica EP155]|uniref:Uncharacterized protein n=1 Tax=Cryphonectria parasitica (strain ATCC 38755 / EP155) TaxID=660469 RepID=A0A9P5CJB1_CRYP1|nr:uncharacterized protein M406DRAFT_335248 [Cryphonectria parasitica EP155]KAF3760037.1 hypothetical protein M406DRAFT_335248 [Cryphonectria parasitica EP155]